MAAVNAPFPADGFSAIPAVTAAADAIAPFFAVKTEPLAALLVAVKTQRAGQR